MIVLVISLAIIRRLDTSIRLFAITMLLVSLWSIAYGFELASKELSDMLFWIRIEYIGISFAPATWLWFCINYTNKERWLRKKYLLLIFLFPVLTYLMVITNDFHQLHYQSTSVDRSGPFPLLAITVGPWYYVHTIVFYISLFLGNYLLFQSFKNANNIYRKQINLLIAAGILPWLINFIYLLGFRPFDHIDLTPYAFLSVYIIVGFGLLKFDLFEIKPIARDKTLSVIEKGIVVFDPINRMIDINAAGRKLLHLPPKGLIGIDCGIVLEQFPDLVSKIKTKEKTTIETFIEKTSAHLSVQFTPILNQKGVHTGVLLFVDDITELKNNQLQIEKQADELNNLNKLKDKLFSIISHDLKGPIHGLNELIKLTNKGIVTKDEFFEILPDIAKNVESVSILMENLLAWTSAQMKGEFVEKRSFDISKLIDQTYELFINRAKEKGVNLKVNKKNQIKVYGDRNMIDLVLRNLVSNAVKFSGLGDQVRIIMDDKYDKVSIEILDTGLGISDENLKKLNSGESFTTLGKNNESGTGLGILLVKDYITKNGGQLLIKSELNKGSSFYFELPKEGPAHQS
ncbi:PAS domain-containing sensor histidine kinase [Mongoliitalea daihaiensis]|nr:PAS domain-containing sensor histidine kinase [Mongoliitalea daihaiensis]